MIGWRWIKYHLSSAYHFGVTMINNPFGSKPLEIPKPEMPKVEEIKAEESNEEVVGITEKLEPILSRKMQILAKYGGLESNVPVNSPYWRMK